jgi:hypothetical protein
MQARTEKIRPVLGCPDLGLCGKWMVTPTHTQLFISFRTSDLWVVAQYIPHMNSAIIYYTKLVLIF